MKTQSKRIEDLENKSSPKVVYVIQEVLDVRNYKNEKLFKYQDEEKLLTLQEAEERFKDGDLLYIVYEDNWRSSRRDEKENGDL